MFSSSRSLLRMLEREREAHAAEVRHLVDVICHLSKNPWTPPPARLESWPVNGDGAVEEPDLFADPGQLP